MLTNFALDFGVAIKNIVSAVHYICMHWNTQYSLVIYSTMVVMKKPTIIGKLLWTSSTNLTDIPTIVYNGKILVSQIIAQMPFRDGEEVRSGLESDADSEDGQRERAGTSPRSQ